MHPDCDNLRTETDNELIEKWITGNTGFPFVDACMLYLRKYGWINFRMRAMLMSFASYNLWQPWQKTSPLLVALLQTMNQVFTYAKYKCKVVSLV